jgi:hypothetical protein
MPVYIEATADETETRLLHGLRKRFPSLEDNLSLKDTLAALRRRQGCPVGKKVLIVLDQFEQWLHAKKDEENTDLVQALRQCDGGRVQCVVMVRDDFWLAVSRFLRELEIRLVEGDNIALADLFDVAHARKVLAAFGRAFDKLPERINDITKEQKGFLRRSVAGLAEDGKVICIRLALFAEMMKGKEWTPATLRAVGGTKGVGVTFLEETFSSRTASPEHRVHQKAARAVLKALLPESGTDIKGQMKSHDELLEASGYGNRPRDFDDLIRILDGEIRLVTPTDPEGVEANDDAVSHAEAGQKFYQLTHDYLVPSLRDWLTRKQKETIRGRAELLLEDRASIWNSRPENRQLPSHIQWLQIRWLTKKNKWTPPQRKMMARAGWYHVVRGVIGTFLVANAIFWGLTMTIREQVVEQQKATYCAGLADSSDPLLKVRLDEAEHGSAEKLRLALALLPFDESQVTYLSQQLPICSREQFPVLRDELLPHKDKLTEGLWQLAQNAEKEAAQRFQTAAALAEFSPDDERWQEIAPFVTQHLTTSVSNYLLNDWLKLFEPANKRLVEVLSDIHADRSGSETRRETAAVALAYFWRNEPEKLVDPLLIADEAAEFAWLLDALKPHAANIKTRLMDEMRSAMPAELDKTNDLLSDEDERLRDNHWKRQSLAAVALVHLGHAEDVWPLLEFNPDPSLQSYLIHHLAKLGTSHNTLAARLKLESDVSIRRALIQSLGDLDAAKITETERNGVVEQLRHLYLHDFDPGIHSSASWALRRWGVELPDLPVGEPKRTAE